MRLSNIHMTMSWVFKSNTKYHETHGGIVIIGNTGLTIAVQTIGSQYEGYHFVQHLLGVNREACRGERMNFSSLR